MADAALRHVASALARLPRRRAAGRDHRRERCPRTIPHGPTPSSDLQERGPRRVLGRDRRRCLCQARHHHRDAADRDRRVARRRCDGISGLARHGAGRATLLGWVTQHVPPRLPLRHCSRGRRQSRVLPSRERSRAYAHASASTSGGCQQSTRWRPNSPTRPSTGPRRKAADHRRAL